MATTKLSLYNGALRLLGERKLASESENIEARYVLDDIWDDDALDTVLELGQWNFAGRTAKLDYAPSITPSFGYKYAFPKPDDFIRTMALCTDEYFNVPLNSYQDEAKTIFTDEQSIYFQYVSNDSAWGADFSLWPSSFTKWVQAWLAKEACAKITQSNELMRDIAEEEEKRFRRAKGNDAMEDPVKWKPLGSWTEGRLGPRTSNSDRGRRDRLIG